MHITQIKESSLYIDDLDRTEHFYTDILNLAVISKQEGRHIFFDAGSSVLLCFLADATKHDDKLPPHFGKGQLHIAFEVPQQDYQRVKEQIRSKDIPIEYEQHWYGEYHSFYFRDPDGHSLEIVPEGMWDQ